MSLLLQIYSVILFVVSFPSSGDGEQSVSIFALIERKKTDMYSALKFITLIEDTLYMCSI